MIIRILPEKRKNIQPMATYRSLPQLEKIQRQRRLYSKALKPAEKNENFLKENRAYAYSY